ncbi:DEAD/DEAH box helicase family protein, partial [Archaeoglobus sp.]
MLESNKVSKIQLLQERLLVDNRRIKLLDVLKEVLTCGEYSGVDITVGFLYLSGLKELKDELKQFFENGGRMRIIIGNVMQEKTFEQLVMAYGSVNKVKEQVTRFGPSSDELIETNSDVYSKIIANTAQNKENEEMITLLKSWLESGQLQIRVFTDEYMHAKTYIFHHRSPTSLGFGLVGSSNLSLPGLYANTELNAPVTLGHYTTLKEWFEEMWEKSEDFNPSLIKVISKSWANPEFLPLPYHVFIRGLYELYRDIIELEVKGLYITTLFEKLYDFQIDAARRAIHIAMKYGGVLISDVVGLGKTYIACATAHDLSLRNLYEGKPHQVAVIAPKHLVHYWEQMLKSFNIDGRVFSAGLLSVSEVRSEKKREMLEYVREKAGVVIVDEAHKYTNPERVSYKTLKPMLVGKYGILLTATPFRKSYSDLINIIRLFIHDPKPPFLGASSWEGLAEM